MEIILAFVMIFIVGLASLGGVFFLSMQRTKLERILFVLVAFATGTILATALLDLIPEANHHLEELIDESILTEEDEFLPYIFIVIGFIVFFILERFIYWFHGHAHEEGREYVCHGTMIEGLEDVRSDGSKKRIKNFAILNLVGDGLHNFLDGVIIVVSFLTSIQAGIVVTLAVLFHELPQEIGDFGILLYGGFKKKKALLFNFISAMIAVGGGIFALLLSDTIELFNMFFLAFSGGGFLYIAAAELMPELLKEKNIKKSVVSATLFILGIIMIFILITVLPHE